MDSMVIDLDVNFCEDHFYFLSTWGICFYFILGVLMKRKKEKKIILKVLFLDGCIVRWLMRWSVSLVRWWTYFLDIRKWIQIDFKSCARLDWAGHLVNTWNCGLLAQKDRVLTLACKKGKQTWKFWIVHQHLFLLPDLSVKS